MDLGPLVGQRLAKLLPKLGRVSVTVLFDRMADGEGEDFVLGPGNRYATASVARDPAAIDHLAGRVRHKHLGIQWDIEYWRWDLGAQAGSSR